MHNLIDSRCRGCTGWLCSTVGVDIRMVLQITGPLDPSNLPNPRTAGQQAPGAKAGDDVSTAQDFSAPDVGKAVDKATPDLPNPAEKAKSIGNPFDSVKGLFNQ